MSKRSRQEAKKAQRKNARTQSAHTSGVENYDTNRQEQPTGFDNV
jgi:hypothetical protein